MANNYTSIKLSFDSAVRFVENLSADNESVKYIFIGNSNAYANSDTTIPDVSDTPADEKSAWNTMFAAKKLTGNDVELVVPKVNWTSGKKYKEYDDRVELANLLVSSQNVEPMYVITPNLGVYLCLSNNASANSTVEPTGDYNSANGFIYNSADGYTWKYLYSLYDSNRFITDSWIPVPTSTRAQEYRSSDRNVVSGTLSKIVVTNSGTGYYDRNLNAASYSTGVTTIPLIDDPTGNIAVNMSVSGNGIPGGTYITAVDFLTKIITLSLPTSNTGSGFLSFKTRVYVDGDGNNDYVASVNLVNTNVQSISVTSQGTGYTRGNVFIYGTGTGATARAVFAPKYGFGFNPARDLVAKSVLISKKIGEIDSTENGLISVDTSFRQYGLLSAPHKYGEKLPISANSANSVMSQTTDLTVVAGSSYNLNETVYQGSTLGTAFFVGIVHAQTDSVIRLINVRGTPTIGSLLKGAVSGVSRALSGVKNPDLEPQSGDILFLQNISKVERTDGQAENIKFVIKF